MKKIEALSWFKAWHARIQATAAEKKAQDAKKLTGSAQKTTTTKRGRDGGGEKTQPSKKAKTPSTHDTGAADSGLSKMSKINEEAKKMLLAGEQNSDVPRVMEASGQVTKEGHEVLKKKGYDASTFTDMHHRWKDGILSEVVALSSSMLRESSSLSALYLDHWGRPADSASGSADGAQTGNDTLRTTEALLRAGFQPKNCYSANLDKSIVERLQKYGANAYHGSLADALSSAKGKWPHDKAFDIIYADFCYGDVTKVLHDLALILKRGGVKVLSYTMTGRGEGMLHERIGLVHDYLSAEGFRLARDTRGDSEHTFAPSSVFTAFYKSCTVVGCQ